MGSTVALVSCVKQKQAVPAAAKDLYTSALFRKMRAFAERRADRWFILSAKYGLLRPDAVVAPYEQTLKEASASARREWALRVHRQLEEAGILETPVTLLWLAGREYQRDLSRLLARFKQLDPLAGLRIGERLAWLNEQL